MNRFTLRRLTWLDSRANELEEAGQRDEALELREKHCQELARRLGPGHPAHLEGLQRLAKCHSNAGRTADAENVYRLAIDHFEIKAAGASLDTEYAGLGAQVLNDLAVLLCSQQRPQDAQPLLGRALELSARYLPTATPALPRVHSNLGNTLLALHQYEAARDQYEQALSLLERRPPSADLVHCLTDLTECLIELEDPDSLAALDRATNQAHRTLTNEASELAQILIRLASLAERAQHHALAIDLLEEAAEIVSGHPEHANLLVHCLKLLSFLQKPRLRISRPL